MKENLIPSFITMDYCIDFVQFPVSSCFFRDRNVELLEIALKETLKVIRS